MTISTNPPSLPGQLYPVLLEINEKITVLESADTLPQTFTAEGNATPLTLGYGTGSTLTGVSVGGLKIEKSVSESGLRTPPLWITPDSTPPTTPNDKLAVVVSGDNLTLQYKNSSGTLKSKSFLLTSDGKVPATCVKLTQYAVGTNRAITAIVTQGGISVGASSVTIQKTGNYEFTLSGATDTPATLGGLWVLKNGVRIDTPALLYGLYNLSATKFIRALTAGDTITFEIAGTNLWDTSALGFNANQATIKLLE